MILAKCSSSTSLKTLENLWFFLTFSVDVEMEHWDKMG